MFIAAAVLDGYSGDTSVGDPNVPDVADGMDGEVCGEPKVVCSRGDGSGCFLNVSGAGLFFSILPGSLASSTSAGVVDSANRDGSLLFDSFRSRPLLVDSRLARWFGMGGASDPDPMV